MALLLISGIDNDFQYTIFAASASIRRAQTVSAICRVSSFDVKETLETPAASGPQKPDACVGMAQTDLAFMGPAEQFGRAKSHRCRILKHALPYFELFELWQMWRQHRYSCLARAFRNA